MSPRVEVLRLTFEEGRSQREVPPASFSTRQSTYPRKGSSDRWVPDLLVTLEGLEFAVEYKHRSRAEQIGQALHAIGKGERAHQQAIPLIVVPYMGDLGRTLCRDARVAWMDLSGNAWIHRDRIRISVSGHENQFSGRGRRPNLFAPKSAQLVRILLVDHDRSFSQKELAEVADVDPGHVSRVVRRLEDAGFVIRDPERGVSAGRPDLLLDAWRDAYDLDEHTFLRGHISVRKPEEAVDRLIETFEQAEVEYALTGLPAAWLYVRHAGYRLVTLYVDRLPARPLLREIGWREEERGGNVWLLRPKDVGVFYGSTDRDGYRCVSAIQTYLDLSHLPERAAEAAETLREKCLTWTGSDDG